MARTERFEFRAPFNMVELLRDDAARRNVDIAKVARAIMAKHFCLFDNPDYLEVFAAEESEEAAPARNKAAMAQRLAALLLDEDTSGFDEEQAPVLRVRRLESVPCGPWREAVDEGQWVPLPRFFMAQLEAREGDILVPASGDSMREAGVLDGMEVLVRPYEGRQPRHGDIVLIQFFLPDGAPPVSTLKFFEGFDETGAPRLFDAKGNAYALPENYVRHDIVGRGIAVAGLL